jgi:hypothetical protein
LLPPSRAHHYSKDLHVLVCCPVKSSSIKYKTEHVNCYICPNATCLLLFNTYSSQSAGPKPKMSNHNPVKHNSPPTRLHSLPLPSPHVPLQQTQQLKQIAKWLQHRTLCCKQRRNARDRSGCVCVCFLSCWQNVCI